MDNVAEEIIKEGNFQFPIDPTFVAESLDLDTAICNIPLENNQYIAAMLISSENMIIINENNCNITTNNPEGFEASSIAHEIGHWVLHINHKNLQKYKQKKELGLELPKIPKLHRTYNNKNLSSIEYQAQYFAGCLLMPKFKLEEVRNNRDLTKWKHLYAIADELCVTISNLTYRLQDLEWIDIPQNSKRIFLGKNQY